MNNPEIYVFPANNGFPNSKLPLLVYCNALPPDPAGMESAFQENGWSGAWLNGIFSYHHFHSIAHEVLGIAAGQVTVAFGGPDGTPVTLQAGDVVVIPAGVAHRKLHQSGDLLVVGAYPGGADYDIRRGDPAELEDVRRAIGKVSIPTRDPVTGEHGWLLKLWPRV